MRPSISTIFHVLNKKLILAFFIAVQLINVLNAQTKSIVLGRPTNNSITASVLFNQNVNFYFVYGTTSGVYTNTTSVYNNTANTPDEIDFINLNANTQYYYQLKYKLSSASVYSTTPEYKFHTQRAPGNTFTFTVESDEHLYDKKGVKSMYEITLQNELNDNPDFMLSLGDIFGDDHTATTITTDSVKQLHLDYRPFLGNIAHSVPFYVCLGNHEGENDFYYSQNPPNNLCVFGTEWRKYYYPNPYPNNFYSGNTDVEPYGIGNPENYYAWTWGDALFVVLDVYRDECYTTLAAKPTNWNWTLGLPQYTWLKNTLENSTATHKFVFAHHTRGQGRGGVKTAKGFEWGGYDGANGTNYGFPANRPGWAKPIHQLFVDNNVNIFFQGHDHLFAHEVLNNVTYQEVPMPADSTYEIGMLANASAYESDTIVGTGHIRVTVSPLCVQVDFVRAYLPADTLSGLHQNGEIAFSYYVGNNCVTSVENKTEKTTTINFYPNPSNDILHILMGNEVNNLLVKMYDVTGKLILQSTSKSIDIADVPNGVYQIQINAGTALETKKIIINHN
jgi:hypothetical protein